jgi:5'-deoxynucleotidase YfbR-like HD superfamily hydrolase
MHPWLQVRNMNGATGVAFNLVQPRPEDVDFRVMARVLSRLPRFNAQTEGDHILSVAQHSIEGALAIIRDIGDHYAAGAFLIHDGHEYVIGDLARPVQEAICTHAVIEGGDVWYGDIVKRAIKTLKSTVDAVIYPAAGYPWPLDPQTVQIVKEYDMRCGRTERDLRMQSFPAPWKDAYQHAELVQRYDANEQPCDEIERDWMGMAQFLLPIYVDNHRNSE